MKMSIALRRSMNRVGTDKYTGRRNDCSLCREVVRRLEVERADNESMFDFLCSDCICAVCPLQILYPILDAESCVGWEDEDEDLSFDGEPCSELIKALKFRMYGEGYDAWIDPRRADEVLDAAEEIIVALKQMDD